VLNLKDSEVNIYKLNIESLENEIELLRELLKKDIDLAKKKKSLDLESGLGN